MIPAVQPGHKVLRGHQGQMVPRDLKGRRVIPVQQGQRVRKAIPEVQWVRKATTVHPGHKDRKAPWEK